MTIYTLFLLIASIAFFGSACYSLVISAHDRLRVLFFTLCFLLGGWLVFETLMVNSAGPGQALVYARIVCGLLAVVLPVLVHFSLTVIGRSKQYKLFLNIAYGFGSIFAFSAFANIAFFKGMVKRAWGYYPLYAEAGTAFAVGTIVAASLSLFFFIREYQKSNDEPEKQSITKIMAVAMVFCVLTTINTLAPLGYNVYPTGVFSALGFLALSVYCIHHFGLEPLIPNKAAESILNELNDPVFACNQNGDITFANQSFYTQFPRANNTDLTVQALLNTSVDQIMNQNKLSLQNGTFVARPTIKPFANQAGQFVILHDITDKEQLRTQMKKTKRTDQLTDLPNRKGFLEHHNDQKQEQALILADIDGLKSVNESFGHKQGDELLRQCGYYFKSIETVTYTARVGGDEFALLVDPINMHDTLDRIAQRFEEKPFAVGDEFLYIDIDMGVHTGTEPGQTALSQAGQALDRSREKPGTSFAYSQDTDNNTNRKKASRVKQAIRQDEITAYYQPIVDKSDHRIKRLEALVRWDHPDEGVLTPGHFLPSAQEYGIMPRLDRAVIDNVLNDQVRHNINCPIHINLTPQHFVGDGPNMLYGALKDLTQRNDIIVEVTESDLITHEEKAGQIIDKLRSTGARIALDDFGTGYSSMSHLQNWTIDEIKIDRSFVDPIPDRGVRMIESLIQFGTKLNKTLVAEGVENKAQANFFSNRSTQLLQGYYFARPASITEFKAVIDKQK